MHLSSGVAGEGGAMVHLPRETTKAYIYICLYISLSRSLALSLSLYIYIYIEG